MVTFISLTIVLLATVLTLEGYQKVYLFLQVLHQDQRLEGVHRVVAYLVAFHLEGDRLVVLRLEGYLLVVDQLDDRLVAFHFMMDCLLGSFLVVGLRHPCRLEAFLVNRLDFHLMGHCILDLDHFVVVLSK